MLPLLDFDQQGTILIDASQGILDSRISFTRASSATDFSSTGTLTVEGVNVPRWDFNPITLQPRGLLLEGARTNEVRNSQFIGATLGFLGSGGLIGTGWSISAGTGVGLTTEVVGIGTELGMSYVELLLTGTAAGTEYQIEFTSTPASPGTIFVASGRLRDISGRNTVNVTDIQARDIQGGFPSTNFAVNGSGAIPGFSQVSRTLNAGGTGVQMRYRITTTAGAVINYRFRIYTPQLEIGHSFASSHIPTTGTAATRAADVATLLNLATLVFNATQGTMVAEFEFNGSLTANNRHIATFSDGGFNNRIRTGYKLNTSTNFISDARISGSTFTSSNGTATQIGKIAVAYAANNYAFANNGSIVPWSSQPTGVPVVDRLSIGCNEPTTGDFLFGWLRRLTYYPTRLPDATLQALTV